MFSNLNKMFVYLNRMFSIIKKNPPTYCYVEGFRIIKVKSLYDTVKNIGPSSILTPLGTIAV